MNKRQLAYKLAYRLLLFLNFPCIILVMNKERKSMKNGIVVIIVVLVIIITRKGNSKRYGKS